MTLADLLLGNDLFQANSKLRDPIEIVKFDVSLSPVVDKATSSESIGNHMSVTFSEQKVEQTELVTSSGRIVESGVTLINSETVVQSSDPIEIGAVTRS